MKDNVLSKEVSRKITGAFSAMPYGEMAHFDYPREYSPEDLFNNLSKLSSALEKVSARHREEREELEKFRKIRDAAKMFFSMIK